MTDWTSLSYVVVDVDVEGNGQQPPELVELAAVPVVDGVVGEPLSWLVRPETPIKHFATRIHGLTNQDVTDCPPFEAVKVNVLMVLSHPALVAHNAHVDVDVLQRKLTGWEPHEVFDTLRLARQLMPGQDSYRLGNLVESFKLAEGLPDDLSPHRATYDALVAARLFVLLATKAASLEELRGQEPGEGEDEAPALF
jgi:exodeoxyribonuclease X